MPVQADSNLIQTNEHALVCIIFFENTGNLFFLIFYFATWKDIDECSSGSHTCGEGTCVNGLGNFSCICPDGLISINNGRQCVDMKQDSCYIQYSIANQTCQQPLTTDMTKKMCCCSVGKAWGSPCEPCPEVGTSTHTKLHKKCF